VIELLKNKMKDCAQAGLFFTSKSSKYGYITGGTSFGNQQLSVQAYIIKNRILGQGHMT